MALFSKESGFFSMVKLIPDLLISGGNILMPISLLVLIARATFSSLLADLEFDSTLNKAVIYSTG